MNHPGSQLDDNFWTALSTHVSKKKTSRIWSQTFYKGRSVPGPLYGISTASQWILEKSATFFDYKECVMAHSVGTETELPRIRIPEFCFAGRSNVGKSSLINAMVGGPACVTSSTPGRTRRINMFHIRELISVVDLPGYGYAEGNEEKISEWVDLLKLYLTKRSNLQKCYHLIDCRYDLFQSDKIFLETMRKFGISVQFVLTKCDEISHEALYKRMESLYKVCDKEPMVAPIIIPTSSRELTGIDELQAQTIIGSGLLETKYFLPRERAQKEMDVENAEAVEDLGKFTKIRDKAIQKKNARRQKRSEKDPERFPADNKETHSVSPKSKISKLPKGMQEINDPEMLNKLRKKRSVIGIDEDVQQ
jgi:GTP-binding protein